MTFKRLTAAAMAFLAPIAAQAATEANFGAKTAGDLVELCGAAPDNPIGIAALNFCQGAVSVEIFDQARRSQDRAFQEGYAAGQRPQ